MRQFAFLFLEMWMPLVLLPGLADCHAQSLMQGSQRTMSIKLADVRPFDSKDKARISLDVQFDWGDGSGYQLLLDSDATAYGEAIPETGELVNGEVPDGLYDVFEYKIPEDATPVFGDHAFLREGETMTIEVPAGAYDYGVVNPADAWTIYFAGGNDSRGNDVEFAAGVEYVFTIEEAGGADNCVLKVRENQDLALTAIASPVMSEGLTGQEEVTVVVENLGKNDVSDYRLSYYVGDNAPVTETVDRILAAGDTMSYTFHAKADLSQPGVFYPITVFVECENDVVPSNDTLSAEIFHIGPLAAPFVCDFEEEADMFWWDVVDADRDGVCWQWSMLGRAMVRFALDNPLDDYLVTLCPVHLDAGKAYAAFEYDAMDENCPESLSVLYGTSKDPGRMESVLELNHFARGTDAVRYGLAVLDIEEAGDYYFAFHASSDPDMFGLWIDNVEIGQGAYEGKPDLAVKEVVLPFSGCGLSAESLVQARVANRGRTDIVSYELSYTVGDETRSKVFHGLPEGADTVVSFAEESLDLSEWGTYQVRVEGRVLESLSGKREENLIDNAAEAAVINFEPVEAPFVTDFSDTLQRADWLDGGYWIWNDAWAAYGGRSGTSLVSRCVSLEEGVGYRFSMRYRAGLYLFGLQVQEDFMVLCGPTGTDIGGWDTLWAGQRYEDGFVTEDVSFVCRNSGNYGFAIVTSGYLWIREAAVKKVEEYDVRVESFSTSVPRLMPEEHGTALQMAAAGVRNRGMHAVDVLVEILQKDVVLGMDTVSLDGLDDYGLADVRFALARTRAGDTLDLKVRATVIGQEESDATLDNEMRIRSYITEEEMAYDAVTEEMFADSTHRIGSEENLACGLPFWVPVKDTLTHIVVGWGYPSGEPVVLTIHEWDPESGRLGNLVCEKKVDAGTESGFVRYEVGPWLLDSGFYMVSEQTAGYILLADASEDGFLYVSSMDPPLLQYGVGYPAIRLFFGKNAALPYRDAEVVDIVRPRLDGVFSSEEEVVARVRNNGSDSAYVVVTLDVNGRHAGSRNLGMDSGETEDVSFVIDMSEPNLEYRLTAFVQMPGDMAPENDTVTRVVESRVANNAIGMPSSVSLYPNPSDGLFTVELAEPARIEVCDMAGCRIHEEECAVAGKYEIDLRGRASGMFLIRIVFDGGVSTHKLLMK